MRAARVRRLWLAGIFGVFFLAVLLYHLPLAASNDDLYYAGVLNGETWTQFLLRHYRVWSARLILDGFMAWFARLPYGVWKVLDSLILASLPWLLCRVTRLEGRPWAAATACGVLAFYPWHHISSAGWMVTTVFYLWTGAAALAAFGLLVRELHGAPARAWQTALALVGMAFACNMESVAVFCALCMVPFTLWRLLRRRPVRVLQAGMTLIPLLMLAFAALSPGLASRTGGETASYWVDMPMRGLAQRLELGLVFSLEPLFFERNWVFLIFCVLLARAAWRCARRPLPLVCAGIPLLASLAFGWAGKWVFRLVPALSAFRPTDYEEGSVVLRTGGSWLTYLPLATCCVLFLLLCVALLAVLGPGIRGWIGMWVLAAGLCTQGMLGFSPTIWISGTRTEFFFILSIMALCLLLVRRCPPHGQVDQLGFGGFSVLTLLMLARLAWQGVSALL